MAPETKTKNPGLTFPFLLTLFWAAAAITYYFYGPKPDPEAEHYQINLALHRTIGCLMWVSVAWLVVRLLDVFLWRRAVLRRTGVEAPRLLVDLVRVAVLIGVFLIIVGVVFKQPINGLLFSSGVVGVVLGFALQNMIADFFSGIAISLEGPFKRGEWIKVDDMVGEVVEVNWRSTRLHTMDDTIVVVPNSTLAQKTVINHEQPQGYFRTSLEIALEYGVPVPEAKRVLLTGIHLAEGVLAEPAPSVVVTNFGADGIEYELRWYIQTYKSSVLIRDRVITAVNDALYRAGLGVPYPKRDVYYAPMPPRELDASQRKPILLSRNELFESLQPDEIRKLAEGLVERRRAAGEDVVQQGADGESLFLIVDGLVEVIVWIDGQEKKVAELRPGQYFGEMSLLTGEPRSATVRAMLESTCYELSKASLLPLLTARPEIADTLSQIVARRQRQLQKVSAEKTDPQQEQEAEQGLASQLLGKIRRFFGLG